MGCRYLFKYIYIYICLFSMHILVLGQLRLLVFFSLPLMPL